MKVKCGKNRPLLHFYFAFCEIVKPDNGSSYAIVSKRLMTQKSEIMKLRHIHSNKLQPLKEPLNIIGDR